jgi:FKBP-type peptidyl-prolyl cis-trans isomerase FkpA
MNIRIAFFIILAGISIASCKNENSSTTKNGFKYKLFKTGKGDFIKTGDIVYLNAMLMHNDSIFLDTRTNPMPFEFVMPHDSQVTNPSPIVDILPLMRAGDSAVVIQPTDSLKNLQPFMKKWKEIQHSFKILRVVGEKEMKTVRDKEAAIITQANKDLEDYKANKLQNMKTTTSGLKYVIHQEGDGAVPKAGEVVNVLYYGAEVSNGKEFDSAYKKGAPFSVIVGQQQVIPGWDEILQTLKKGTSATVFIPSKLAYGERGIPGIIAPNSDLMFYIDVIK